MPIVAVIVLLVLVLAPDLYIALVVIRDSSLVLRCLHWLPLALLLIFVLMAVTGFPKVSHQVTMTAMFAVVLLFYLPKYFFMLISLLGRLLGLLWRAAPAGADWFGLAVAAALFCAAFYGFMFGWRRIVVNEKEVMLADLPASFEGYRIAHLSDLHLGTYSLEPAIVDRIVKAVDDSSPDMIVFTGDIVNAHPSEAYMFEDELARLKAPDGVYSVMGNHDYCEYYSFKSDVERAKAVEEVGNVERRAGWDLLMDESRVIRRESDSLAVVGVQNISKPPFPVIGDLHKALEGLPDGMFKILLSHDPSHWRFGVLPDSDVQLTLSGHTHALHLRFGKFSPAKFVYPEWGGFYYYSGGTGSHGTGSHGDGSNNVGSHGAGSHGDGSSDVSGSITVDMVSTEPMGPGDRILHVSAGTGGNVPFRLGAWPEIDVLTLRRK